MSDLDFSTSDVRFPESDIGSRLLYPIIFHDKHHNIHSKQNKTYLRYKRSRPPYIFLHRDFSKPIHTFRKSRKRISRQFLPFRQRFITFVKQES